MQILREHLMARTRTYIPHTVVRVNGVKIVKGKTIRENGVHIELMEGHS